MELTREEMKEQLTSLGIEFKGNAKTEDLAALIAQTELDEGDRVQEEADTAAVEAISNRPKNNRVERSGDTKLLKRQAIVAAARKRSKVIVYNNDKRDAEKTTCFSSVRNSYFGDGKVIPLGKEWWVEQMHIDNLKSISYLVFISDKDGNKTAKEAKKYTIDIIETDEEAAKARLAKEAKK